MTPRLRGATQGWQVALAARKKEGRRRRREHRADRAQNLRTPIRSPAGAGIENLDSQSHGASSQFHVSQRRFRSCSVGRVDKHGNTSGCGHQLAQEFQALCHQLGSEDINPCQVAARSVEAGNKIKPDGSSLTMNTIGTVMVAALAASAAGGPVAAMTVTRR
jgi:hypothetical protein